MKSGPIKQLFFSILQARGLAGGETGGNGTGAGGTVNGGGTSTGDGAASGG